MPLTISSDAISEKNKLSNSGAWLLLLEVIYPGETSIRVCLNTENITWDGETWYGVPFNLDDIEESNEGEVTETSITVYDIERRIIPYIDAYDGGVGATAYIYIVHSNHLDNTTPELDMDFEILDVNINHKSQVKFKLGGENLSNYRSPPDIFLQSHCRYKEFKGSLCGYTGAETECDRTFARCKELNNQRRFGGFPGIGRLGYVE